MIRAIRRFFGYRPTFGKKAVNRRVLAAGMVA